jgi:uncharacterized protein YegJ (DUF2314 family)
MIKLKANISFYALLAAILLISAFSSVYKQSAIDTVQNEGYVAAADDVDMTDAFLQAGKGLESFLAMWKNPPAGTSKFFVKVGMSENGSTEYFWISGFRKEKNGFIGAISEEPQMVTSVKLGDEIKFTKAQIVDWLYSKNGKMVGNYTQCAILKKQSESERNAFEQQFGLKCGT